MQQRLRFTDRKPIEIMKEALMRIITKRRIIITAVIATFGLIGASHSDDKSGSSGRNHVSTSTQNDTTGDGSAGGQDGQSSGGDLPELPSSVTDPNYWSDVCAAGTACSSGGGFLPDFVPGGGLSNNLN